MYIRCPKCREQLYVGEHGITLSERQRAILQAIPEVRRGNGHRTATTTAIAMRVGWSERTTRYELSHLEHLGEVAREGRRRGWLLAERPVMMVA